MPLAAAIQPSLHLIGRILCLLRGLNCGAWLSGGQPDRGKSPPERGGAFNRSPLGRSQFTSSRELPDDYLEFPPLRELRPRLGAPARVGTGKLSNHPSHHLSHHHSHHHPNQFFHVPAPTP